MITWTTQGEGTTVGERPAWAERLRSSFGLGEAGGIRTKRTARLSVLIPRPPLADIISFHAPARRTSHEDAD